MPGPSSVRVREAPELGARPADYLASILRGGAGVIPFVGSALAELLGIVIPNQRLDRAERYIQLLAEELSAIASRAPLSEEVIASEGSANLVEEGMAHALRATSDDRLRYIAKIVAEGLGTAELEAVLRIRLLRLLSELDDGELLLLYAIDQNEPALLERFRPRQLGFEPTGEQMTKEYLLRAGRAKLVRMQLIDECQDHRAGEALVDEGGQPTARYSVPPLGQVLVRALGWKKW